jgi:hypothetical protein
VFDYPKCYFNSRSIQLYAKQTAIQILGYCFPPLFSVGLFRNRAARTPSIAELTDLANEFGLHCEDGELEYYKGMPLKYSRFGLCLSGS